jgi:hypothetical protein
MGGASAPPNFFDHRSKIVRDRIENRTYIHSQDRHTPTGENVMAWRPSDSLNEENLETYYSPFSKEQIALAERSREVEYEHQLSLSELFSDD